MKTLAIAFLFTFLASASLYAQQSLAERLARTREFEWGNSHFDDFAVNGKFYHRIRLNRVRNGIAELNSNEGHVSTSWDNLPHVFQHAYATEKANADAQEAKKSKTDTEQSDTDHLPAKLVGMSQTELTSLFGPPANIATDPIFTGCLDLSVKARSLADGEPIMMHATCGGGVCLAILYVKIGTDKAPLAPQEIARWMLTYTQGTAASWKQEGPDKWVLARGTGVPYTYHAQRLQPNTFSIEAQELYDYVHKAEQEAKSDVQKIPGLSEAPPADQNVSNELGIPGLKKP